ncbi:unnamed protein product [Caenorhabditis angaria]|uniref:Uncharacterized protein n=1 Tax=Caenorhabditis angaria TaxID=860376 RepID=A0A9P1N243_9PELO|nr:unnamed protein product [Caenorhabditis angaria]
MLIFIFLITIFCPATILADTTCPTCPTGGIWSSWTSTETCATTCGACSNITRTRTCLSDASTCPCVGATTSTAPCGTVACNFPRVSVNTTNCCTGSLMVYNNLYHCGPIDAAYSLSCCPTGGYWSEWTDYSSSTGQSPWTRTRKCISSNYGCPCTGVSSESKNVCPCTTPTLIASADTSCSSVVPAGYIPYNSDARPGFNGRPSICTAYTFIESSNALGSFLYMDSANLVKSMTAYIKPDGTCFTSEVSPADRITMSGQIGRLTFTCNLKTGYFQTSENVDFVKFAQFYKT